jgi:beta-lactam-binding protein with PASTA domain
MNESPKPVVHASPRWNRIMSLKALGILAGVTLLMFVIGYFTAVRILFPPLEEPENGIVVPDLAGQTVEGAQRTLRALGLRVTEVMAIEHPTEPEGLVTAQSPLPGQQLREMGAVRLAVSAGALPVRAAVPVPDSSTAPAPPAAPASEPAPAPDSVIWTVPPPADSAAPPDSVSFSH